VQWGDPDNQRPLPAGIGKLAPEFDSPMSRHPAFTRLPDGDVYAPEVGFSNGFPAARAPQLQLAWLAHCYAMVGVARNCTWSSAKRRASWTAMSRWLGES
jgi:peptidylprolyl isomerase